MSELAAEATEAPDASPFEAPVSPEDGETDPDEPTPADGEPEPGEAPEAAEAALDAPDVEKAMDKLGREATRHANRVSEIMGDDANLLVPCELCAPGIPGFRFPFPPDAETTAAVKTALGEPPEPDYQPADNADTCPECQGYGKRTSGSKVPDQRILLCSACGGKGWRGTGAVPPSATALSVSAPTVELVQVAPEDMPEQDPWGRGPDHPDYGRLPNYTRA